MHRPDRFLLVRDPEQPARQLRRRDQHVHKREQFLDAGENIIQIYRDDRTRRLGFLCQGDARFGIVRGAVQHAAIARDLERDVVFFSTGFSPLGNGTLPLNNLIEMPLEDKERVEALKGSSALYYGFSAPSGIVPLN